jgi:chromate transport protein ChrA
MKTEILRVTQKGLLQFTPDNSGRQSGEPSVPTLFLAFSGVAVSGFGGVMPFARRMLVERRRWMTPEEFNEAYALAQFLPGGNILNLSVVVGRRFRGAAGALAAIGGLLVGPFLIMIAMARYMPVTAGSPKWATLWPA